MKRILLTLAVCALMATPALSNPTGAPDFLPDLSTWPAGSARTTHQYWTFSEDYVKQSLAVYNADPEESENQKAFAVIGADAGTLGWYGDETNGAFYGDNITVALKIDNFENPGGYKLIWVDVDIGYRDVIDVTSISATDGGSTTFDYYLLTPELGSSADFGIKIVPNPRFEEIHFTILGESGADLYYIHADTICIPAPGAILLGSIGVAFVGWLRRRRTL